MKKLTYIFVGIAVILGVYFLFSIDNSLKKIKSLLFPQQEYYIPKPEALLKINLPDSNSTFHAIDNFTFSHSNSAVVLSDDNVNYSIYYPDYDAKIKFYHALSLNLEVDRFYFEKEVNVHENQGAYIAEMPIENKVLNIFGILYFIEGNNVATSASFFITDSIENIVSGNIEFSTSIDYQILPQNKIMKMEVLKFIESFRWIEIDE